MRVAMIDPSLFTLPYDRALALALAERGHAVTLIARPLAPEEAWPAERVPFLPLFYGSALCRGARSGGRRLRRIAKGADHIATLARLPAALERIAPDVIHLQWTPLPAVDALALPRLRRIAPVVLTVHDTVPFNGDPAARLQALGALGVCRRVDRAVVHTEEGRARLIAAGMAADRLARIDHGPLVAAPANGPGAAPPEPPPEADAAAEAETETERPVVVRLVGKIKPYKGADTLLAAAARLPPPLRRRMRIEIIGEPHMDLAPLVALSRALGLEDRTTVEAAFLDEVTFHRRLATADILAFPYRHIDASGVLAASLGHGRATVASAIGGFAETLAPVADRALVPPDDPDALATALAPLIADAAARRRLGTAIAAIARGRPGWDAAARDTEALYAAVAHPAARAGARRRAA